MDEEKTKYLNFLCQELFGRNFLRKKCNCFFQLSEADRGQKLFLVLGETFQKSFIQD